MRIDGRKHDELRPVVITPHIQEYAEGSAQVKYGKTTVICSASLDEKVPKWLQGEDKGWVTAEYCMLPRSTHTRIRRDKALNSGRTQEISRLIARSLRSVVDLSKIKEKQLIVDCDVFTADGGTRTAAITGGYVAMALAFKKLMDLGELKEWPIREAVSAVSVGFKENTALLDLNYDEDCTIDTDMNFVLTESGHFVEIQGTAEQAPFDQVGLESMVNLARKGCAELVTAQKKVLEPLL